MFVLFFCCPFKITYHILHILRMGSAHWSGRFRDLEGFLFFLRPLSAIDQRHFWSLHWVAWTRGLG
jgi:hypothetical protein